MYGKIESKKPRVMTQPPETLFKAEIRSLPLLYSGKVRDVFDIDDQYMLIVTTDRLSAFDVVLPDPVPGKGLVLTAISNFWFKRMNHIIPNHLTDIELSAVISDPDEVSLLQGRGIIVRKLKPLPIEAIVRGYIIGSGWKEYQECGSISGLKLPSGLKQAQQLPHPIFTPSTKAEVGDHDVNISFADMQRKLGDSLASQVREISLSIYQEAAAYALERGIIIADTKFAPDSSRFWPRDSYHTGISPPSFDKQYVRDYLETLDWDKTAPGPRLPKQVLNNTAAKYREAEKRLIN